MDPITASAGVSVLGNIVGSGVQGIINRRAERRQWNRNVAMWEKQNAYNAPKQQMQRLSEAGLNPNLMYGKGTVGNSQTLPQYNAIPTQGMSDLFGKSVAGLQGILDVKAKELANENADIQNKKDAIDLRFKEREKEIELEQKETDRDISRSSLAISFYREQQERIKTNQAKFGIDGASTEYKALFQHMYENLSMEELSNAVRNMALTSIGYKALRDVIGVSAVSKIFRNKNQKTFQSAGYSKKAKNFYPKGQGTSLNDYYRGPGQ